jgi:hypothetical protein
MKVHVTIEANPRAWRRSRRLLVVGAFVLAIALPAAVLAIDRFDDVPNDQIFHNQISAIAGAGITTGCGAPAARTYCPEDFVRRDAMAAFMHRGFGRVTLDDLTTATPGTSEAAPAGWTYSITPGLPAGALAGAAGFIKTEATISINLTNATGCPCQYRAALYVTGFGYMVPRYTDVTLDTVGQIVNLSMTGAIGVTSPGAKTVEVRIFRSSGSGSANAYGNSTSTYFPFGGTGVNTLDFATDDSPSGDTGTGN